MNTEETITTHKPPRLRKPSKPFRSKVTRDDSRKREHTLDLEKVKTWAQVGCTESEIAGLLGVSQDWFSRAVKNSHELESAIIGGQVEMKQGLRSAQVRLALTGHAGMLIWLGKQFLGQSDKQEVKQETQVNVTLQNAMREIRELPREDVLAIKDIIEAKYEEIKEGAPATDAPSTNGIIGT